jgi:periplasmic divalent cation tolerance protein
VNPLAAGARRPDFSAIMSLLIGWTTVSTRPEAEVLARGLVGARLAACAQIDGPLTSVYEWRGRVEQAEEFRLCVKFVPERAAEIEAWLRAHHPYDTPEWVAVRAAQVAEKYLSWARAGSTSAPL